MHNLLIVNILFFICKSSYNVKYIDVTKYVVAMVVTASKTSKSYVINQFHCQRLNFTFLEQKSLTKGQYSTQRNIEKLLFIRRIRGIYYTSFTFSFMILVLNRILAIVKINSAVIKVITRRFRRSPFLVKKIES